jgi:hypothetical protein
MKVLCILWILRSVKLGDANEKNIIYNYYIDPLLYSFC